MQLNNRSSGKNPGAKEPNLKQEQRARLVKLIDSSLQTVTLLMEHNLPECRPLTLRILGELADLPHGCTCVIQAHSGKQAT